MLTWTTSWRQLTKTSSKSLDRGLLKGGGEESRGTIAETHPRDFKREIDEIG